MKIINNVNALRQYLAHGKQRVALVPTMGSLHAGHLSLIRLAQAHADTVVVSIYVNPLQFSPDEDFDQYPRNFDTDAEYCRKEGVDVLFHPDTLYAKNKPDISLHTGQINTYLCGADRPKHFDGVATVVSILFHIVQPTIAVFGEKDWQQLVIIQKMVQDLYMPVTILAAPTVREKDGLAMSSRNRYLNPQDRQRAPLLHQTLCALAEEVSRGNKDACQLIQSGTQNLQDAGFHVQYLDIRHAQHLTKLTTFEHGQPARIFAAASLNDTRLIDNIALEMP